MEFMASLRENNEMAESELPQNVYLKFLSFCSQALSNENPKFLELIRAKYETCDLEFRSSERMINLLKETQENMQKEPSRIFVHLKDLITELKAFGLTKKVKKKKKEPILTASSLEASGGGISPAQTIPKLLECSVALVKTDLKTVLKEKTADRTSDPSCLISNGSLNCCKEIVQLEQSDPVESSLTSHSVFFSNCEPSSDEMSHDYSLKERTTCTNRLGAGDFSGVQNCLKNGSPQKKLTTIHDIGYHGSENIDKIVPFTVEDSSCTLEDKAKSTVFGLTKLDKNDLSSGKDTLEYSKQASQVMESESICKTSCSDQQTATDDRGQILEKSPITTNDLEGVSKISDVGHSIAGAELTEPPDVQNFALVSSKDSLTTGHSDVLHASSVQHPVGILDSDDEVCVINSGVDGSHKILTTNKKPESSVEHSTHIQNVPAETIRKQGTGHNKLNDVEKKEPKRVNLTSVLPSWEKPETQSKFAIKPAISGQSRKADEEGTSADEFQENTQDETSKSKPNQRHVRKLENLLESLRNEIEKCQKRELSLDDLEDETSSYIYEDKLKKKFVAAWRKLCEITNRSVSTGRPTERTIKFNGTRYKEINRRLERFLNKKKVFPDFFDVKNIVTLTNKKYKMKLSAMTINELAREAFVDIGEMLQTRRHQDFIATFGNRQTDTLRTGGVDPYLTDPELRRKLDSNRKLARHNLDEVIAKYTRLQNERHYDDDDEDDDEEGEQDDMNEDDGKHTDDDDNVDSPHKEGRKTAKDNVDSPHKERRKTAELDEGESIYNYDSDTSMKVTVLPGDLSAAASDSPSKRSTKQETKPKYDPLQMQLNENPHLARSDGQRQLNSQIQSFVKALGLNPSVQTCDSQDKTSQASVQTCDTPERPSQANVIVIDESPTPTRSAREFTLKKLGSCSSSDTEDKSDGVTNHEAICDLYSGSDKMTLSKKPNIKFTARKMLPPESKPLKKYTANEDDDVMISYEEIAKENLEDSEDQSSDAGSENNDPVLDDEDDDIMVIESSESEIGSESSRGGSPVSIISLGSSLDDEEMFENDIDLVNKMFKIKKEVVSPQKETSVAKGEVNDFQRTLRDPLKSKSFKDSPKLGRIRERMSSTYTNTKNQISHVLDLASSSCVPGLRQNNLLTKRSQTGTDFLDLASCQVVSAAGRHKKVALNRDKCSLKNENKVIQEPDTDCIVISDVKSCEPAHLDSIISDQGGHDNKSQTESGVSQGGKLTCPERTSSIMIADVVGGENTREESNNIWKEEDLRTGETQGGDAGVISMVSSDALIECTENLEVAIEIDESCIGASEMGLPLAAENDTYILHQDKGKSLHAPLNNKKHLEAQGQKEVDLIKNAYLPGFSKGQASRSQRLAAQSKEDHSVIIIDENSQDLADNHLKLTTGTFQSKSRQTSKDFEKHEATASVSKQRFPVARNHMEANQVSGLSSSLPANVKEQHNSLKSRDPCRGVTAREQHNSLKSRDSGRGVTAREQHNSLKSRDSGRGVTTKHLKSSNQEPVIEIDCSDDDEGQANQTCAISDNEGGFIRNETPDSEVQARLRLGADSLSIKELVADKDSETESHVQDMSFPIAVADTTNVAQPAHHRDESQEVLIISHVCSQASEGDTKVSLTNMPNLDVAPKTPDCIHNLRESVQPSFQSEVSLSKDDRRIPIVSGEHEEQPDSTLSVSAVVELVEDLMVSDETNDTSPADETNDANRCTPNISGNVEEVKLVSKDGESESLTSGEVTVQYCAGVRASKVNSDKTDDVVLVEENTGRGEGGENKDQEVNLQKPSLSVSKEMEETSFQEDTRISTTGALGDAVSHIESDGPETPGSFASLEAQGQDVSSKTGDKEVNLTSLDPAGQVARSDGSIQTKSDEVSLSDTESHDRVSDDIEEDEDAFKSIFRICDKMLRNDKQLVDEKQLPAASPLTVPDSVGASDPCKLDSTGLRSNIDTGLDNSSAGQVDTYNTWTENKDLEESVSQDVNRAESSELEVSSSVAASSNLNHEDRLKEGEGHEKPGHVSSDNGVITTEIVGASLDETNEGASKQDDSKKRKRSESTEDCESEIEIIEELSSAKGKRLCARSKEDDRKLIDQLLEGMVFQATHLSATAPSTESASTTEDKTLATGSPKNSKNIEGEDPGLELECDLVEDGSSPTTSAGTSPTELIPFVPKSSTKKRERESDDVIEEPAGGQDENSAKGKSVRPFFKKPKTNINFIDEIISSIYNEIPPKAKSKQQPTVQDDAEDDVVLVDAHFEPKPSVRPKSAVRTSGNISFNPISSSTPKNIRSNPYYRTSPGQQISSRVRPNATGFSPFRPSQGNSNTASRPITQNSSTFSPYIPGNSRYRSHNTGQLAQPSRVPTLKPRVPIPNIVHQQQATVLNSQFRPRNTRFQPSHGFRPVSGERRHHQQARHIRGTSSGFLPYSSVSGGHVYPKGQPGPSSSSYSPGRPQGTKLPLARNIDGAQIVLDESDTDDPSGGGQVAHSVPKILSVTSLKPDSKYVPSKREDLKRQSVDSKGQKESVRKRPGDVIVLSDSE